jgi:hypothetical protein
MGGQSVGMSSRSSVIAVTVEPPDEQELIPTEVTLRRDTIPGLER